MEISLEFSIDEKTAKTFHCFVLVESVGFGNAHECTLGRLCIKYVWDSRIPESRFFFQNDYLRNTHAYTDTRSLTTGITWFLSRSVTSLGGKNGKCTWNTNAIYDLREMKMHLCWWMREIGIYRRMSKVCVCACWCAKHTHDGIFKCIYCWFVCDFTLIAWLVWVCDMCLSLSAYAISYVVILCALLWIYVRSYEVSSMFVDLECIAHRTYQANGKWTGPYRIICVSNTFISAQVDDSSEYERNTWSFCGKICLFNFYFFVFSLIWEELHSELLFRHSFGEVKWLWKKRNSYQKWANFNIKLYFCILIIEYIV